MGPGAVVTAAVGLMRPHDAVQSCHACNVLLVTENGVRDFVHPRIVLHNVF